MAVAIAVRARFFARLRELAGVESEGLQVPPGSTMRDVYEDLRGRHPALPARESVRGALNQEFAEWDAKVSDGDEVAFIPPVSGGARCAMT
jgi:MoaE-MoaD fusion protein